MAESFRTLIKLLVNYILDGKDPPPSYMEKLIELKANIQKKINENGNISQIEERLYEDAINQINLILDEIMSYYEFKEALKRYVLGISPKEIKEKSKTGVEEIDKAASTKVMEYSPKDTSVKLLLVVFREDVPKFVGEDLKVYGPFSKGDVAWIPESNVKILERRGVIEVVA